MSDSGITPRPLRAFLCHSSSDKEAIRSLYRRLHDDGILPWFDEEDLLPGQEWDREIRSAVDRSDVVIVFLSRESVGREGYVQKEIRYALDVADEKPEGTIFVIPARLEECSVPVRLRRWQWVDLFHEEGYGRLIQALSARAGSVDATIQPGSLTSRSSADSQRRFEISAPEASEADVSKLLATAANIERDRVVLVRLYLEDPTDYDRFNSTLGLWSDALIAALAKSAPDDLALIVANLHKHLPRNFPYSYLNTIARLLGRIYRITEDRAVRDSALHSLLRIGMRYDERDMGKEFATLAGRAQSRRALYPLVAVMKENWPGAMWVKEYLVSAGVWPRVVDALADVGIHFADLGEPTSESAFDLVGWGEAAGPGAVFPSTSGDKTLREQNLRSDNSVTFVGLPKGDLVLTAEISDGQCDDSFQILLGDEVAYTYRHQTQQSYTFGPHVVPVQEALVEDGRLTITFRNVANDECGSAGVYNVKIERAPSD